MVRELREPVAVLEWENANLRRRLEEKPPPAPPPFARPSVPPGRNPVEFSAGPAGFARDLGHAVHEREESILSAALGRSINAKLQPLPHLPAPNPISTESRSQSTPDLSAYTTIPVSAA